MPAESFITCEHGQGENARQGYGYGSAFRKPIQAAKRHDKSILYNKIPEFITISADFREKSIGISFYLPKIIIANTDRICLTLH